MIPNSTAMSNVVCGRVIAWVESIKTVNEKQKNLWNHWTEEDVPRERERERVENGEERGVPEREWPQRKLFCLAQRLPSELRLRSCHFCIPGSCQWRFILPIFYVTLNSILLPNVIALIFCFTSLILLNLFGWFMFLAKRRKKKQKRLCCCYWTFCMDVM